MRILVMGGTSFVGRAIVEEALLRGDDVTLLSRGRTGTQLFPGVPRLVGDRDTGDYAELAGALLVGSDWDAVADVTAYVPRHVTELADALGDHGGRYLLISTGSVYDKAKAEPDAMAEDAPRLAPVRGTEQVTGETYGGLKVACEDDAQSAFAGRLTIVRPGIVAGPFDVTDRFTYWARRAARGGRVAVPARLDQPVQVVDSRDLARLVLQLLHDDRPGTFNAVGPAEPVTLAGLVQACAAGAGTTVELVGVDQGAVAEGFPLVLPDPSWDALYRRSAAAARAVGLTATPLARTAADTLAWDTGRGTPPLAVELTAEQEDALLQGAGQSA